MTGWFQQGYRSMRLDVVFGEDFYQVGVVKTPQVLGDGLNGELE